MVKRKIGEKARGAGRRWIGQLDNWTIALARLGRELFLHAADPARHPSFFSSFI